MTSTGRPRFTGVTIEVPQVNTIQVHVERPEQDRQVETTRAGRSWVEHGDPAIATGPDQMIKDVYTRETVAAELSDAGFEDVKIENVRRDSDPSALWMNVVARRPR